MKGQIIPAMGAAHREKNNTNGVLKGRNNCGLNACFKFKVFFDARTQTENAQRKFVFLFSLFFNSSLASYQQILSNKSIAK